MSNLQIETEPVSLSGDDSDDDDAVGEEDWPPFGAVSFRDVTLRYREHLPASLRSVSFAVPPGQKAGVVGRTGAGKSSLFRCLLRTAPPPSSGRVAVDGEDVLRVGLARLRRGIAVIPQQPFLFEGTVAENLDPLRFGRRQRRRSRRSNRGQEEEDDSDRQWTALSQVHLREAVEAMGGLGARLRAAGLSTGQKQLFCLARALLSRSRLVLVDEATANVDRETDRLVQSVLRRCFQARTVLTIAHRVGTVMDADRVLIMEGGAVAEEGDPRELLRDPTSAFTRMVAAGGCGLDTGGEDQN